jgi:hypothetical protein
MNYFNCRIVASIAPSPKPTSFVRFLTTIHPNAKPSTTTKPHANFEAFRMSPLYQRAKLDVHVKPGSTPVTVSALYAHRTSETATLMPQHRLRLSTSHIHALGPCIYSPPGIFTPMHSAPHPAHHSLPPESSNPGYAFIALPNS